MGKLGNHVNDAGDAAEAYIRHDYLPLLGDKRFHPNEKLVNKANPPAVKPD